MEGDADLLERWRAGDGTAGELLLARHFDAVCRFFYNKVGDDAPDLIQQTFLACCEGKGRIRDDGEFRTYLFGAARNVLFTHFRSKKRRAARFDPLMQSAADFAAATPAAMLARRREEQLLLQALRTLPVELQVAFELYHLEGMTAVQLAAIHGLTEGGMYGRLRKARLLVVDACERLAQNPSLRESTVSRLEDWAVSLRDFVPLEKR